MRFEIQRVRDVELSRVAAFLYSWHRDRQELASRRAIIRSADSIEQCLRWFLVDNPANGAVDAHYGFCAVDESGAIRGLSLNFPNAFMAADKRLVGLCSGSYFVEPSVRTAGYYLFKRYLEVPGYAFYFATTCNANSAIIWEKLRGQPVPDSQTEYILPLRFDAMLPALLARLSASRFARRLARAAGRGGNVLSAPFRRSTTTLQVEPSRDWEKLSALSVRHRSPDLMTAERSSSILQWRYGKSSPNRDADVCLFRDRQGREGWFALGQRMLGHDGRIRAALVLDAVWPRNTMHFKEVLRAIILRALPWADAIYLPSRPGVDYRECSRLVVRRTLESARVWTLAPKGSATPDWGQLDLVMADGDSGWSNRFENATLGDSSARPAPRKLSAASE